MVRGVSVNDQLKDADRQAFPIGRESDVEYLLFHPEKSDSVDAYRSRVSLADHERPPEESVLIPRYPLSQNLAPLPRGCFCEVRLPTAPDDVMTHTKVLLDEASTGAELIERVLSKCLMRVSDAKFDEADSYILKVRGMNEFIDGDEVVFQDRYVQDCIRSVHPIRLTILSKNGLLDRQRKGREETPDPSKAEEKFMVSDVTGVTTVSFLLSVSLFLCVTH